MIVVLSLSTVTLLAWPRSSNVMPSGSGQPVTMTNAVGTSGVGRRAAAVLVTAAGRRVVEEDVGRATDGGQIPDPIADRVRTPTQPASRGRRRFQCRRRSTERSLTGLVLLPLRHDSRVLDPQRRACAKRHSRIPVYLLLSRVGCKNL